MEVKKDILWRVYLCFILMACAGVAIISKAFYIQQVQGDYWRGMSDSLHTKIQEVPAERGTIYSEDGEMLSTSVPQFDIYIDFAADGLKENNGILFKDNVDSLSNALADLFKDRSAVAYKILLSDGFRKKTRYFLLKRNISFDEFQRLKEFPLVRLGRNKSGFIAELKNTRLNPYQLLAFRTIGLDRDNAQKVGLEKTFDTTLSGINGRRLVRYVAGGIGITADEDITVDPQNGNDIVTTLDTHIQEITENALMKMMVQNEAEHGCAIVMEVKTGKIKAIANLGRNEDGSYWEDLNYAMMPSEPGSTFKLATLLSLLEDRKFTLSNTVDLEGGSWRINRRTVYDSENHGMHEVTVKRAFELSSNVGMAKLVYAGYSSQPSAFTNHLQKLHLNTTTGIDLYGERPPVIYTPGSRHWSATTLPWMAFGYNLAITPLHTAMLYNAVANNGKMMQPYLLNAVMKNGKVLETKKSVVLNDSICCHKTLQQLQECLKGVCSEEGATAYKLFKNAAYSVAGKTGTALVANGSKGYGDHIYQSSFAGYFPANNPEYTCVVVIKNKPHAAVFYGASVAGPVFREIADRLVTLSSSRQFAEYEKQSFADSSNYRYAGYNSDIKSLLEKLHVSYRDSSQTEWISMTQKEDAPFLSGVKISGKTMPALTGMTLKDALFICENLGLKVKSQGEGRVIAQSIQQGETFGKNEFINLSLRISE